MRTSFHEHILTSEDESHPKRPKPQPSDISNSPLFPLNTTELLQVSSNLLKNALPASITQISVFLTGIICLRYVGKYGESEDELAGATLGFTWTNVFCLGILSSINQGFGVYAAQMQGAGKYRELGIFLQRNLCVETVVMIPLLLSLCFADSVLIAVGLKYEISINTGIFLRNVIPSLIGQAYFDMMKSLLMSQGHFTIQPIIQGSTSIVHIFWCHFFVNVQNMKAIEGIAIAKSITDVTNAILIYLYIRYTNICEKSWIPWEKECLENWLGHLKATLMIGANLYIEWISFEASIFIIGALNDEHVLAAHGIAITLTTLFFMLPLGNNLAMQSRLGNFVGEGSVNKAQKIMAAGLSLNVILTTFNVVVMVVWIDDITAFFTDDSRTREVLKNIMIMYAIVHGPDTIGNHISGILKTVGKERNVMFCFVICYVLFAINGEWILGLVFGYGYVGVWVAFCLSLLMMLAMLIRIFVRIDWKEEIGKVRNRVMEKSKEIKDDKDYVEMKEVV